MVYKLGDKIKAKNPITGEIVDLNAEPNHIGIVFFDKNKDRRFLEDGLVKLSLTNCAIEDADNPVHWDIIE